MSGLLLKPILLLTLTFAVFSLAARALGSTQPANPALEGFTVGCEGKPQPCWYGIVPGVTTVEEASSLLQTSGYLRAYMPQYIQGEGLNCGRIWINREFDHEWRWPRDNRVWGIHISQCDNILLGSLIGSLGTPNMVVPNSGPLQLIYSPHMMVTIISSSNYSWVSVSSRVVGIYITLPELLWLPPVGISYKWHGFGSLDNYKRHEPRVTGNWWLGG